jgi:hypothetical protein
VQGVGGKKKECENNNRIKHEITIKISFYSATDAYKKIPQAKTSRANKSLLLPYRVLVIIN